MPDLKINLDDAVYMLRQQTDAAVERLRSTANGLIDDVKLVIETLSGDMSKLNVNNADAACVLDFYSGYESRDITMQLSGGYSSHVQLVSPLKKGKYRAVILFNKLPDETP
jgi:hypothetical protein